MKGPKSSYLPRFNKDTHSGRLHQVCSQVRIEFGTLVALTIRIIQLVCCWLSSRYKRTTICTKTFVTIYRRGSCQPASHNIHLAITGLPSYEEKRGSIEHQGATTYDDHIPNRHTGEFVLLPPMRHIRAESQHLKPILKQASVSVNLAGSSPRKTHSICNKLTAKVKPK